MKKNIHGELDSIHGRRSCQSNGGSYDPSMSASEKNTTGNTWAARAKWPSCLRTLVHW